MEFPYNIIDLTHSLEENACATPLLSEAGQASSRLLADIFID